MAPPSSKSTRPRHKFFETSGQELLAGRFKVSYDHMLGEGSFSRVYKGLDRTCNREVAVKIYKCSPADDDWQACMTHFKETLNTMQVIADAGLGRDEHPVAARKPPPSSAKPLPARQHRRRSFEADIIEDDISRSTSQLLETSVLQSIDTSQCFVQVLGNSEQANAPGMDPELEKLFIVFELGGESLEDTLEEHAAEGKMLSVEELRHIQWSLVSIVCGLHAAGFVHMDIKPANIVLFGKFWKLVDFDGARPSGTIMRVEEMCMTPMYMAPEVAKLALDEHETTQVSRLMDVWSVGLCAIEVVFLQPVMRPWYTEWFEETGNSAKFMAWLGDYKADPVLMDADMCEAMTQIDPEMGELLQGMLIKDPNERFDIARCLTHPWFEPIRSKVWNDKFGQEPTKLAGRRGSLLGALGIGGGEGQKGAKACVMM
mmetsp:Transcript_54765/g.138760  ORF Transcript_54765/g.138760 Transcript_54765/m.138760 type:complete len:429 (+) Transcript_54765:94-1380(+)